MAGFNFSGFGGKFGFFFGFGCSFLGCFYCLLLVYFSLFGFQGFIVDGIDGFFIKADTGHAGSFAGAVAHVAEVVAPDLAPFGYFDLDNQRAMEQKTLFNTDAAGNTADRNAAGMAALLVSADYQALENLDTLFIALTDLLVNFYGITAADVDDGRFFEAVINCLNYTWHIR